MKTYKLRKPISFEGKKVDSFNFDFEKLTRKDYKRCVKEMKLRLPKKEYVAMPILNETFQLIFAAAAAGVVSEMMFYLYPQDTVAIGNKVGRFFFGDDFQDNDDDDDENENEQICKYKLKDPIEYNGEKITEFMLDFDSITPMKYKQCVAELRKRKSKKEIILTPSDSEDFQLIFAAEAAKVPVEVMFSLSVRDSFAVSLEAKNFLSAGDSDEEEENEDRIVKLESKESLKTEEN